MELAPVPTPSWLKEANERIKLIQVLSMAFDPSIDDRSVRIALQRIAEDLGKQFGKAP